MQRRLTLLHKGFRKVRVVSLLLVVLGNAVFTINLLASSNQSETTTINLPHTDGSGLPAKLKALPSDQRKHLYQKGLRSCSEQCVTPFGTVLGIADGAVAYSNCRSTCIHPEFSFLNLKTHEITLHPKAPKNDNLHYIGLVYQCVEYARKWWMLNKGITFGSIDSAFEIIYLTEGKDIRTDKTFPLGRSINGSARRPPKIGDLIIYGADFDNPQWRHGHVAVVVDVDLANGSVSLAEENYNNQPWQDAKKFARKIRLFEVSGRYTLMDVDLKSHQNSTGSAISGWIYPLQ